MTATASAAPARYARTAGVLYLLIAVIAAFSIGYVPSVIVVDGDATATATNLLANQGLFGLSIAADMAIMLIEIALSVMLYFMLRPVSPTLALISVVARLAEVMVMATNVLLHVMAVVILNGSGPFTPAEQQATAMLLIEAHGYGIHIWDVFFGFSLFFLGYAVAKSGYLPRLLGWGMLIGSFGYVAQGLSSLTFVEHDVLSTAIVGFLTVATLAEVSFGLWLLIRGVNVRAFEEKRALATAA